MKNLLLLLVCFVSTAARLLRPGGAKTLLAESLLLRHQLLLLNRSRKRAPRLTALDRILLGFWTLLIHPRRLLKNAVILKPSTLFEFHRALVQRKYRLLFSARGNRRPGPKGPSEELIRAIVETKLRNPRYGCPRIALLISRVFGVDIDKDVVRRVLAKHYRPPEGNHGPSSLTFIGHMRDSLWSIDLFRCESIRLKSHWVMVIMDQYTRRIIGFAVQAANVDGTALCRMFNQAISGMGVPKYLSSDHDPLFTFSQWQANLRILEVEEIKTVPYVPVSHPFVERLIGTIRREYLDHVLFWDDGDLLRKLEQFKGFYNGYRVHQALGGETPSGKAGHSLLGCTHLAKFRLRSHCRGLFQTPVVA